MSRKLVVNTSTSQDVADYVNDDRAGKKTATTFTEENIVVGDTDNDIKGSTVPLASIPKLEGLPFATGEIPESTGVDGHFQTSGKKFNNSDSLDSSNSTVSTNNIIKDYIDDKTGTDQILEI